MAGAAAGGAETAFAELCAAQMKAGMRVTAACRPSARNEALRGAGIDVVELPFGGAFDFKTRRALKKLIRSQKPDVAVTWMNRAAKKMPRRAGIPWIARLGGYYNLKYYKGVDEFVVNAPDIGRWMADNGVPEKRIAYIPNFAEVAPNAAPVPRASLDTPNDAFVFLTLARLHPNKAIDTLISAFAQVDDAYLWIAGEGPERRMLENLARTHGVQDRVRFLGWRDDRWALLAACDAFVLPSRHEPFGNAFMQAWAAGRALVTTNSEGPGHYVRDGVNGLVTPVDDIPAMAAAMNRLRRDGDLRRNLAAAGQTSYRQTFDKAVILQQWEDLFTRLARTS